MSFKITIEQTKEVVKRGFKEWKVIGEEFKEGNDRPVQVYGYTPEIDKVVIETDRIYEQTVDDMDFKTVIGVINKIIR